jgi:NodT family efflux transporter outer membrane factor (OMF) lipoprotein
VHSAAIDVDTRPVASPPTTRRAGVAGGIAIAAAMLTVSCTLGPNYKRPAVQMPAAFRGDTAAAGNQARPESVADVKWAELFRDDTLTSLVTTALQQNFDLRIAAERVLQARAFFRVTRSNQFPAVDASLDASTNRLSRTGANGEIPADVSADLSFTRVGFGLGWELDVWGRLRRLTESARAQYLATEEARHAVVTTLVADVTDTYITLRALDMEAEIARRTRDIGVESLRLTTARRDRGIVSGLDVRQAEQLLYLATGQIAGIERSVAQIEHALSLLLGRAPGDVPRGPALDAFRVPPAVPAGLPSSLLERRPDIRQAEQELIAATAQIGAAKAEYFPRISLTGFFGAESRALSDVLSAPARTWSAGVGAAAPIFNAGRTRGNVELAEAVAREAVVNYERTIYVALREVADALAAYRKTAEQRGEQERLVDALRQSAGLSTQRYQGGLDNYLQVLDAQRNLFQGELDLTRLRREELGAIVQLYRALGGGWA